MTTRRDDGADQPRCGHVHHHESNGGLGRMGHNAIDAKPWCEPRPEPAAPPPDQPRPRWYIDWWNLAFVAVFLIGYIVGRVS